MSNKDTNTDSDSDSDIQTAIDYSDPEVKRLSNLPLVGRLFKEPKKSNKSKQKKGLTGIDMIDNIFKPEKEEEEPIRRYVNPVDFDYGEKVNEKILDMPVIDAYITLFGSIIFLAISIYIIYMIIKLLLF